MKKNCPFRVCITLSQPLEGQQMFSDIFVYFIQTTSDHSNLLTKAIAQRVSVQHRIALCDQFHLAIAASSLLKPLANGKEYLVSQKPHATSQNRLSNPPPTSSVSFTRHNWLPGDCRPVSQLMWLELWLFSSSGFSVSEKLSCVKRVR